MATKSITFDLNGKRVDVTTDPERKLLAVLRENFGLIGTKEGCGQGDCGSCGVLVDGRLVLSCLLPVGKVAGKAVLTIEGLGSAENLHPIQQAFVDLGAVQCGFCTPATILAAKALLDRYPDPDDERIKKALGRHLCRCTGYGSIVAAVKMAAARLRGEDVPGPNVTDGGVGERVISVDTVAKVTGTLRYAADLEHEGLLVARVLRSPHAHAEIAGIDVSPALAYDGVVGVLTAGDVPGIKVSGYTDPKDQPWLAMHKVRHVGEAVAVVVAESETAARQALKKISVDYRLLPVMSDASQALKPDAATVHSGGNIALERELNRGDSSQGFAQADVIVENSYEMPFIEHAYLEPEAGIAYLDASGRIVVAAGQQNSHYIQEQIALLLDVNRDRIRVIQTPLGGAFGGKIDVSLQGFLALAVHKFGRPVRMVYGRAESFVASTKRHRFHITMKHGARRDGKLVAMQGRMTIDTGAYASLGPNVLTRALIHCSGPYDIPNIHMHNRLIYTNNPMAGAMRGFSCPQVTFAVESQMDQLAQQLNMDPWELRHRNAFRAGGVTATGQVLSQAVGIVPTLEAVRNFIHQHPLGAGSTPPESHIKRGRGYGSMFYGCGYTAMRNPSPVEIELSARGDFHIYSGAVDMGQGTATFLRQMAAEDLHAPFDRFEVTLADTDFTTDSKTTCASRTVYYSGNALRAAVTGLKNTIREALSEISGQAIENFSIDTDGIRSDDVKVTFQQLYDHCKQRGRVLKSSGCCDPEVTALDANGQGRPYAVFSYATQMAEVEVDLSSGRVKVLRVVSAHDVGRAVNPLSVTAQIEGSVVMGLGYALLEEYEPEKTPTLKQYQIPRFKDAPEISALLVEERDATGPYGAKGVAECALIPTAASIANAIADAIGKRVCRLPATPARIKALIAADA